MAARRRGPDWLRSLPLAHRGLHDAVGGRPENSLAAFDAACRSGWGITLDARLSADGHVVVFGDPVVERLTGRRGRVADLPARQLTRMRLQGTDQRIPTLSEALAVIAGRVPVLVEVKNFARPGRLERHVAGALRPYAGECAVQSVNPQSLVSLRALLARPRGQIGGRLPGLPPSRRLALEALMANAVAWPDFIAYRADDLPSLPVRVWRSLGFPVLAWTVTSAVQEAHALRWADNVTFAGYRPSGAAGPRGAPRAGVRTRRPAGR